jgi:hypothetical protein
MGKIWNRIVYGKSTKPKYIASKKMWLYNNQWISHNTAYDVISGHHILYTYSIYKNEYATFGTVSDFNELVELTYKNPTNISFADLTQFSTQELAILVGIQHQALKAKKEKLLEAVEEFEESIKE